MHKKLVGVENSTVFVCLFRAHEWSKHGTCCQDLPATTGEHSYFAKALELNKKYSIDRQVHRRSDFA